MFRFLQGRNLAGAEGLFPQSYTTPAPPSAQDTSNADTASSPRKPALQTLAEESESESPTQPHIASPIPKAPGATFLNGNDDLQADDDGGAAGDGEMMKATLTDVQKAIEQLGRNRVDVDGERSFSFASTRDGGTESDFDMSDTDNVDESNTEGEDWHKGARKKLAEKARKAVEEAERLEQMMGSHSAVAERRSTAPPIDVELSDESEDEGEHDRQDFTTASFQRMHPHIPEEDEDEVISSPADFGLSKRFSEQQQPEPSVTRTPQAEPSQPLPQSSPLQHKNESEAPATREAPPPVVVPPVSAPTPIPAPILFSPPPQSPITAKPINHIPPVENKRNSAPTPINQSNGSSPAASGFTQQSAPFEGTSVSSFSTNPSSVVHAQSTGEEDKKERKHPNDWTVEDVVEWLKGRGFDQDVCDKFTGAFGCLPALFTLCADQNESGQNKKSQATSFSKST